MGLKGDARMNDDYLEMEERPRFHDAEILSFYSDIEEDVGWCSYHSGRI